MTRQPHHQLHYQNEQVDPLRTDGQVITGATGFVGGELLKRLLGRPDGRGITCLVPASSDREAQDVGVATLTRLLGRQPERCELARVEWIRADLEADRMGWDRATWNRVASQTNEIYHCATTTKLDLALEAAHRITVTGTKHAHQLALTANAITGTFLRFHHLSTAYVAGRTTERVHAARLPPDRAHLYRNSFERTHARAERYLRATITGPERGRLPVSIYRPSIIAGESDSDSSVYSNAVYPNAVYSNAVYGPMRMAAFGQLPTFPRAGRGLLDTVAVDVVADAILALGKSARLGFHAYHLAAGPGAFAIDDLLETTTALARRHPDYAPSHAKRITPARWLALEAAARVAGSAPRWTGSMRSNGRVASRHFEKCSMYVPYTGVNSIFDMTRERALLMRHGISQPDPHEYLDTIITDALHTGFGDANQPTVNKLSSRSTASSASTGDTEPPKIRVSVEPSTLAV